MAVAVRNASLRSRLAPRFRATPLLFASLIKGKLDTKASPHTGDNNLY